MKYAKFSIDNEIVEVYNSILGIESVNLNGRIVSKGFSFFGRNHLFKIKDDCYRITPQLSLNNYTGIAILVYKNGEQLVLENLLAKADKKRLILRTIIGISLGAFIGVSLSMGFSWFSDMINWF